MRLRRTCRGSAVVDFVLVLPLLVFLLFAVLQIAFYFYARNITAAAAADGARYAAAAGVDPSAGGVRADAVERSALRATASSIRCGGAADVDAASGLQVTTVRCRGALRLVFLPLGAPLRIDVRSSVLRERAP